MRKKIYLLLIGMAAATFMFTLKFDFTKAKGEEERLVDVIELAWDQYDVQGSMVLNEEPALYLKIKNKDEKEELQKMMEENLKRINLEHYSIIIDLENPS
jgi:Fe-S cluster biosynthesis and repair protein YggX